MAIITSEKNRFYKNIGKTPFSVLLLVCISLSMAACTALISPNIKTDVVKLKKGQYRIDPSHATLLFKIGHLGLSTYVGRFNDVEATLNFDPDNLTATTLDAIVKTASVDVNNKELEATLNKKSWFNTAQYPYATFKTLSVLSDNSFKFTGALTLLGITRPVVLHVSFNGGANNILTGRYTLGFSATAQLQRSSFGMNKYIGLIADTVALEIYAEFLRE